MAQDPSFVDNPFVAALQLDSMTPEQQQAYQQQVAQLQQQALSQMTAEQQQAYLAMTPDQQLAYLQQYAAASAQQQAGADAAYQEQLAQVQHQAFSQMSPQQQQAYLAMTPEQQIAYLQQYAAAAQQQVEAAASAQHARLSDPGYQQQLAQAQQQALSQMTAEQQQAYLAMTPDQQLAYLEQYAAASAPSAPAASAGRSAAPAEPAAQAAAMPGLEDEDFEGNLAQRRQKTRLILIGVVAAVLIGALLFYFLVGSSDIGETAFEETPGADEHVEFEMADPDWKPLPTIAVPIASVPPGARVVINGELQKGKQTPGDFPFLDGQTNTISLFVDGYLPVHRVIADGGIDVTQGVELTLEPIPEPPPPPVDPMDPAATGGTPPPPPAPGTPPPPVYDPKQFLTEVTLRGADPESRDITVWVDGVEVGKTPIAVEVARNSVHHVLFEQEGKAPTVVVFEPTQKVYVVEAAMMDGVFLNRTTRVIMEPSPQTAMVNFNDEPHSGKAMLTFPKGQLLRMDLTEQGYEPWQFSVSTAAAGVFVLQPVLRQYKTGKSAVQWVTPEEQYWYACLLSKDVRDKVVCWDDKNSRNQKPVDAGKWEVKAWEQLAGGSQNRRNAKNKPELVLEPGFAYQLQLDLTTDDAVIEVLKQEPLPEDPAATPPVAP